MQPVHLFILLLAGTAYSAPVSGPLTVNSLSQSLLPSGTEDGSWSSLPRHAKRMSSSAKTRVTPTAQKNTPENRSSKPWMNNEQMKNLEHFSLVLKMEDMIRKESAADKTADAFWDLHNKAQTGSKAAKDYEQQALNYEKKAAGYLKSFHAYVKQRDELLGLKPMDTVD